MTPQTQNHEGKDGNTKNQAVQKAKSLEEIKRQFKVSIWRQAKILPATRKSSGRIAVL